MKFITWLGDKQVSADMIREWKADLLTAGTRSSSINTWLADLRSFCGWLAERDEIPFDPTQAIKGATHKGTKKRHVRESLTDREVVRLLEQPMRASPEGARDYAIICIMLYTAAPVEMNYIAPTWATTAHWYCRYKARDMMRRMIF